MEPVLPMGDVVSTCPISSREEIDPDVFSSMTSLGCFRDKHKLIDALLAPRLVKKLRLVHQTCIHVHV